MNNLNKKICAIFVIVSLLLTNNAMNVFSNSIDYNMEIDNVAENDIDVVDNENVDNIENDDIEKEEFSSEEQLDVIIEEPEIVGDIDDDVDDEDGILDEEPEEDENTDSNDVEESDEYIENIIEVENNESIDDEVQNKEVENEQQVEKFDDEIDNNESINDKIETDNEEGNIVKDEQEDNIILGTEKKVEDIETKSNKFDLFGAPAGGETLILDFGDGPGIEYTNFSSKVDIFTKSENTYSITHTGGSKVSDIITEVPTMTYGSGVHVLLPKMNEDVSWEGYKFSGWVNDEGNEETTFKYAFQYSGEDTTYTAVWSPDESKTYTFTKIVNIINDDSTITNVSTINETFNADDLVISVVSQMQGYELTESNIEIKNIKKRFLNEEKGNGSINMSEPIAYNPSTMVIKGYMPNDDVVVTCNYTSTKNSEFEFKINYKNQDGNEIADSSVQSFSAGDKKTANPINITGYIYKSMSIDNGTEADADLGVYPLGTIDGDNYIHNSDTGEFSAIMPNQDVEITYNYEANTNFTIKVVISQIYEGVTDPINTEINIPYGRMSETQYVDILDKTNEGYGIPDIRTENSISLGAFNDTTKKQAYTITDVDGGIIKIIYSIDYSLPYWSKITYTNSSNGTISATTGSPDLTNRYISTGAHTLSELVQNIEVVPEENYVFDGWYIGLSVGVGKVGNKLSNTESINVASSMTLYANFIENAANYIDISFIAGANGTLTGNNLPQHLLKNVTWGSITKPTYNPNTGYVFSKWIDDNGNTPTDSTILTKSATYTAVFSLDMTDDGLRTKPICKTSFATNGLGNIKIIGAYTERKYVITNESGVVESVLTGDQAVSGAFSNLYPGMKYDVYEVLKTVDINKGDNISAVSNSNKSEKQTVGIKSLNTNFTKTTTEIRVTPVSGVSYALIDNSYNVKYDFTTNPVFQNLDKDNYYIVVAKKSDAEGGATDYITEGVIVGTSSKDTSNSTFKLILIGATAANLTNVSSSADSNVYEVKKGTQVRLQGTTGNVWEIVAGNLNSINRNNQNQTITMPQSDLVIVNRPNEITDSSITIEKDSDIGIRNYNDVLTALYNRESTTDKQKGVKYYLMYDKKPLSYSDFMSLSDSNKSKYYSYTIGFTLGRTVLGVSKPLIAGSYESLDIETSYIFDNLAMDGDSYGRISGTGSSEGEVLSDYDKNIASGLMSTYFNIRYNNRKGYNYKKVYSVNVKSETGLKYSENFLVGKGENLTNATNYANLQSLMTDYRDDSAVDATTGSFGSKKYIYKGIKYNNEDYDVNQAVNQQLDLKLEFVLDEARETAKTNLNNAIVALENKINSFTADVSEEDVATVSELQRTSIELRNAQYDKTIEELVDGYNLIIKVINDFGGAVKPANNGGNSGNNSGGSGSRSGGRSRGSSGGGGGGGGFANVQVQMEPVKLAVDPNDDITIAGNIFDNQVTTIVNQATYVSTTNGDFIIAPSVTNPGELTLQFHFYDDTRDTPKNTWMNVKFYDEYGREHTRTYRMDENGQTKTGWHIENNRLYYFSENPSENFASLQYGWIKNPSTGNWYYANNTNGTILTGWQNIDGKYYYFADNDVLTSEYLNGKKTISGYGRLYMNTITPDGHLVDENGALVRYTP